MDCFVHKIPSVKRYPITEFVTWVVVVFTLSFFLLPLFVSAELKKVGVGHVRLEHAAVGDWKVW